LILGDFGGENTLPVDHSFQAEIRQPILATHEPRTTNHEPRTKKQKSQILLFLFLKKWQLTPMVKCINNLVLQLCLNNLRQAIHQHVAVYIYDCITSAPGTLHPSSATTYHYNPNHKQHHHHTHLPHPNNSKTHQDTPKINFECKDTIPPCPQPTDLRNTYATTYDSSHVTYYGYRYYSPELGRWITRDPIEEKSFRSMKRIQLLKEYYSKINPTSFISFYQFLNNAPITQVDKLGLDRWVGVALDGHSYIIVAVWYCHGKYKKVTGYRRIDFGPKRLSTAVNPLCCGRISSPFVESSKTNGLVKIESSCEADRIFIETIEDLEKNPPNYNALFFNCRHFTHCLRDVGISGKPDCPVSHVPAYPPVYPKRKGDKPHKKKQLPTYPPMIYPLPLL
jgi:RHS repeat-associated protein